MAIGKGKLLDAAAIAARLRMTREALGLNKREFCREAGIGESAYNQYESGARRLTMIAALKLCERFGLTLDWLYRGDRSGLPERITARLPRFTAFVDSPGYAGAAEPQPPKFSRRKRNHAS